MDQVNDQLKSQGWTQQKKDFGAIHCSLLTPPANQKDAPYATGCFTEAKGALISIASLGKTAIPIEIIKALLDAAISHAP